MQLDNSRMVLVSIFAGIAFVVGIGIGVELYFVTSESSSTSDETTSEIVAQDQ